jgi:hypothetical protein
VLGRTVEPHTSSYQTVLPRAKRDCDQESGENGPASGLVLSGVTGTRRPRQTEHAIWQRMAPNAWNQCRFETLSYHRTKLNDHQVRQIGGEANEK